MISILKFSPALLLGLALAGCGNNATQTASNSAQTDGATATTGDASGGESGGKTVKFLNVSYDPTRELYKDFNAQFAAKWKKQSGETLEIDTSHGGSGKQARSVIDGLEADVVTLALALDVDTIADKGLLAKDWQKRLPDNSSPYTSTIVFLVRKGNPKGIKDWGDLAKPGVKVVTPNPKTGGGARWNFLAAWGWALEQPGGNEKTARELLTKIYKNVPVLDSGARGSLTTFTERGIGDVLLSWENEALLATKELGVGKYDIVTPSTSILCEPTVAVVDSVVKKHGTEKVAEAYLKELYTPEGQEIAARHYYRPRDAKAAAKYKANFPNIKLWTLQSKFGSWREAQKKYFESGGVFDQIYTPGG